MAQVHPDCPLCGKDAPLPLYSSTLQAEASQAGYSYDVLVDGHHPIVRCSECGAIYACPRDSAEALEAMYRDGTVESYLKEADGKCFGFAEDARRLKALLPDGGRLLEIGCAAGLFLEAAEAAGFAVEGIDPWTAAASHAQQTFGDRVRSEMFNPDDYPQNTYDAIVLWDVLEHLEKPLQLLQAARQLLKPGGILALSTPDVDHISRRILRGKWHFLERPHLVFFGHRTIGTLLRQNGFECLRCTGQWKRYSLKYFVGYTAKWLPRLSRFLLQHVGVASWGERIAFSLPSGCMRVFARKSD